jgi:hypothetical protein
MQAQAFQDHGTKLTTLNEDAKVIQSLVTIARARKWEQITVKGTEEFRREIWFEATRAGLIVQGYKPNGAERLKLAGELAQNARARAADSAPTAVPPAAAPSSVTTIPDNASGRQPSQRLKAAAANDPPSTGAPSSIIDLDTSVAKATASQIRVAATQAWEIRRAQRGSTSHDKGRAVVNNNDRGSDAGL